MPEEKLYPRAKGHKVVNCLSPLREERKTFEALVGFGGFADARTWRRIAGLSISDFRRHLKALLEKGYVELVDFDGPTTYQITDNWIDIVETDVFCHS